MYNPNYVPSGVNNKYNDYYIKENHVKIPRKWDSQSAFMGGVFYPDGGYVLADSAPHKMDMKEATPDYTKTGPGSMPGFFGFPNALLPVTIVLRDLLMPAAAGDYFIYENGGGNLGLAVYTTASGQLCVRSGDGTTAIDGAGLLGFPIPLTGTGAYGTTFDLTVEVDPTVSTLKVWFGKRLMMAETLAPVSAWTGSSGGFLFSGATSGGMAAGVPITPWPNTQGTLEAYHNKKVPVPKDGENLLDLSLDTFASTTVGWTTVRPRLAIENTAGTVTTRGGWSAFLEKDTYYTFEWDTPKKPTDGAGAPYIRVSPDYALSAGFSVFDTADLSGEKALLGTGSVMWFGHSRAAGSAFGYTINKYSVKKVVKPPVAPSLIFQGDMESGVNSGFGGSNGGIDPTGRPLVNVPAPHPWNRKKALKSAGNNVYMRLIDALGSSTNKFITYGDLANKTFRFTGWVYVPTGFDKTVRASLRVDKADNTGVAFYNSASTFPTAHDTWQQFDMTVLVPVGTKSASFLLFQMPTGPTGPWAYYLTDLSTTEVT